MHDDEFAPEDHDGEGEEHDQGLVLVHHSLVALYLMLCSLHWSAKGDPSYGDHLLWDRAQKRVRKDVDRVAELVASIYEADVLDPLAGLDAVRLTLSIPDADEHPSVRALSVLGHVAELVVTVHDGIADGEDETLTEREGLEATNVLAGVADHLNEIAYLAQQRLGGREASDAMMDDAARVQGARLARRSED